MVYKTTMMSMYYKVVLLFLLSLHCGNNAENTSCGVTREENQIVNIKKSRATSNTTRAIKGLNLTDETLCRQKCCDNSDCTVYVFYNSHKRQFNCFLIKCEPTSNCVRSSLHGSVVGVLKRNSLNLAQPLKVTSFKSKQGVRLETSITQTPLDTSPTVMEQPAQRGMQTSPTSGHTASATSTSPPHASTSATSASSVPPPTASTHASTHAAQVNATTYKQSTTQNPSTEHQHTNKTSLVIALFFGLLFLLAVIVIVGRPWWEFIQRPRYSKVDYLMNGL